ncbi:MAG: hypothetical protein LBT46_01125 [Planctomycetaceae bacterium]|jgi:RsiW-degrading membrane proteinase PrsW (M82 family)|nr:hypothetical protein [Planctomycetaceae bacterium]
MNSNIYLDLELDLDPPVVGAAALTAKLEQNIGEWNKRAVANPKFSVKVAAARKFIKDGLPDTEKQAAEARSEKLSQLRYAAEQLKLVGKIDEKGFTKLKQIFPCFTEETVRKESGYTEETPFHIPKMPSSLDCNRRIPAVEMESIVQDLGTAANGQFQNLYELLGFSPETKRDILLKKADAENEANRKVSKKTPEVNAKNRLYGKALLYFKDDYNQLDYDAALQRQKFELLCKSTLQYRAVKGVITTAIYEQSISDAMNCGLTKAEAEWLVYEYYCVKQKCPPPITLDVSGQTIVIPPGTFWNWLFSAVSAPPKKPKESAPVDVLRSLSLDAEPTLLLESFSYKDVKEAITPIDKDNLPILFGDTAFWKAGLLCILPMMIFAVAQNVIVLIGTWFLIAVLLVAVCGWFRKLIVRSSDESLRLPFAALIWTGTIGTAILLCLHHCYGNDWGTAVKWETINNESITAYSGNIYLLNTILEEIVKIIPVVIYVLWMRSRCSLKMIFLIAAFSVLGLFAAKILLPIIVTEGGSLAFFIADMNSDNPLAGFSLIVNNVLWTALFAYFISCAVVSGKDRLKFVSLGLFTAVLLHFMYEYLFLMQMYHIAMLLICAGFILFYGYLTKIRYQIRQQAEQNTPA